MTLERKYRRLLLAYPPEYRRARAGELLDTLIAATPPGRTRPPLRQAISLLRHGMRARLGRPASRGVVVLAVFGALIAGFVGAQFASWAAWHTARPLPDAAAAAAIDRLVAPDAPAPIWHRRDELFYISLGTEYDPATAEPGSIYATHATSAAVPTSEVEIAERARARLLAAGWELSDVSSRGGGTTFYAKGDGLIMTVTASHRTTPQLFLDIYRAEPVLVPIAQALGALAGALLGWLVIGWASRRLTGRRTVLTVLGVMGIAAAFAAFVPAIALVALVEVGRAFRPAWDPMPGFLVFAYPLSRELAVPAALVALAAVSPAALIRVRSRDAT